MTQNETRWVHIRDWSDAPPGWIPPSSLLEVPWTLDLREARRQFNESNFSDFISYLVQFHNCSPARVEDFDCYKAGDL